MKSRVDQDIPWGTRYCLKCRKTGFAESDLFCWDDGTGLQTAGRLFDELCPVCKASGRGTSPSDGTPASCVRCGGRGWLRANYDSQGREQDERGYALPEEPDPYDGFFKGLRTLATTVGFILAVGVLATVLMGAYELVVWIWK
jgi:hypothetical protein